MDVFDKNDLKKTADLARIEISGEKEEKLLKDLGKIISYFNELGAVRTEEAALITGGTDLQNAARGDEAGDYELLHRGREQFPERKNDFLETPPVFGNEE